MSDIFLSYASEDVERAGELARALMRCGWTVWWDRSILPGKVFDTVIEAELTAAKCVIVLWSQRSVASRWVRAEAGEALDKGRLIPVLIDDAVIPLVFRQVQAAPLADWDGDSAHPGFQQLMQAIGAMAPLPAGLAAHGATRTDAANQPRVMPEPGGGTHPDHRAGWWAFFTLAALVIAGGAFLYLRDDSAGLSRVAEGLPPQPSPDQSPDPIRASPAPQAEQTAAAAKPAEPEPESPRPDTPPTPVKRENTPADRPAPVAAKPAAAVPAVKPAPETHAAVQPAETAVAPAAPLTVLAVAWAMPNDNGVASVARIKEYSSDLSRMMTAVVDRVVDRPVRFEYYYPDQQEHYRLLKDSDNAASKKLCATRRADLVVAGFVKGAQLVSASYGYALTRDPVFSVFDCSTNRKTAKTYQVAEKVGDRFPFEQSLTGAFRNFVHQEAALAQR